MGSPCASDRVPAVRTRAGPTDPSQSGRTGHPHDTGSRPLDNPYRSASSQDRMDRSEACAVVRDTAATCRGSPSHPPVAALVLVAPSAENLAFQKFARLAAREPGGSKDADGF